MILYQAHLSIYRNQHRLLHEWSWQGRAGEVWVILGQNGTGKTTLLHTLAGLLPYTQGHILLANKQLSHYSRRELAQQVGLLLQAPETSLPTTVEEAVMAGRYPHQQRWQTNTNHDLTIVHAALEQLSLTHLRTTSCTRLSGGEQRRVAIATLLAQQPTVYLLDEPTNHLDIAQQHTILRHLSQLAMQTGKLIVMTLHDLSLASRYATHAILLYGDGRWQAGPAKDYLTPTQLSAVFQYPFESEEKE